MIDENNTTEETIPLKPLKCELGVLTRSDGSAMVCQGDTTVMASIYGPSEAKPQKLLIDKAFIEAHYRPKAGLPNISDRLRESLIRNTCETALLGVLFPRTSITVIIQEMQDSGGLISCAVNAACLAMLDCGIDMKYLVASVSCMLDRDDNIILDPGRLTLEKANATFVFVFDSVDHNVVASHTTGMFSDVQYHEGLSKCKEASKVIFHFYKNIIKRKHRIKV